MITFYYKDYIEMNGKGLTKAVYDNSECTADEALQGMLEELSEETGIYEGYSLYFTGDMNGEYHIRVDYTDLSNRKLDKLYAWLDNNTEIIKES